MGCTVEGGGTGQTQFPPPLPGVSGFHASPWNMIDLVEVPNTPGDYVISFRYDCEQTSQVWQQCGDVTITEGPPPPLDQCDNPACAPCCGEGTCHNCRGYCEEHKDVRLAGVLSHFQRIGCPQHSQWSHGFHQWI